ncbi:arylsulfatase [Aspergillus terreus]|uniref:Arylsulfatase n=1 Tax=Aspergillus terreus TaxID=33178 RepID=A0A5M3Z1I6_ASPTE|nr:hypothetical protein ATETN484_0007044700 [Aspergillus terreus]GFF16252.1 arylsulfatase [Aspergillus terreus]
MASDNTTRSERPNFLIVVADDLGFSDCGCFGSEIQTPNIDSLAEDSTGGLRFTSFHVAAACSPTRSMLMTGTDHHITGLGQLSEFIRSSPAHQGKPGHEGYLNDRVVALPELLRDGGYHTVMSGKWHLGLKPEYSPQARGFQKSFALLPGCANHYGWEPQYEDIINEPGRFFETAVTALHMEGSDYVSDLPESFYSSDFYATELIEYLEERTDAEKAKPFFAYLPFSAPHWPLQAPKESADKYRDFYTGGPDVLRAQRLQRLKDLGLVSRDIKPHDVVTAPGEPAAWTELSEDERARSARAMEVYAGMVDRMDHNIGRVLDYLRATGEYDNTYIYFMSDNGAEGASYEARDIIGPRVTEHIQKYYDNSLDNIGRYNSFVWYGSRWAQAATAPSRLYKMFSTEGGCRVPLVLKPAKRFVQDCSVRGSKSGAITDAFCTVMDVVPTILELAGLQHPSEYRGKPVAPVRGKSWKAYLDALALGRSDRNTSIHPEDHVTGWEIAGSGALRQGRFKITYVPHPHGPQRWELFDIIEDPGETTDLSGCRPEIFEKLLGLWTQYKEDVGVVGLAGEELDLKGDNVDEFQDTGKWIRFLGKKDIPEQVKAQMAV